MDISINGKAGSPNIILFRALRYAGQVPSNDNFDRIIRGLKLIINTRPTRPVAVVSCLLKKLTSLLRARTSKHFGSGLYPDSRSQAD